MMAAIVMQSGGVPDARPVSLAATIAAMLPSLSE